MSVLVDTIVIADLFYNDPIWAGWSREQLIQYAEESFINPLVYSELCCRATSVDEVNQSLASLGLQYRELPKESLYLAAQAFRIYRGRGGVKTSPLPDFFIGAHAVTLGVPILTRDVTRYRAYFPSVSLICP